MKIVILEGSPHKQGASNTLADSFIKGAKDAGHEVTILDLPRMNLNPCLGCNRQNFEEPCIQKDDGNILREELLSADMLVFVTPVYFYDMSAQLKIAIDRMHCIYPLFKEKHLKSALIATACRKDAEVMKYLTDIYKGLAEYLNFENCGEILATGVEYASINENSKYLIQAYELGKNLQGE